MRGTKIWFSVGALLCGSLFALASGRVLPGIRQGAAGANGATGDVAFTTIGALATSGSTQATAAPITKRYTQLTETNGTRLGARLPAATGSGALYLIDSMALTDFWNLYPAVGEQMNSFGANGSSRLSQGALFHCADYAAANWTCTVEIVTPNAANNASFLNNGTGVSIGGTTTFNGNIGQNAAFASSAQFVGLSTTTLTASSGATFQSNIISGTDATSNTTLATGATIRGATLVTGGTANQAGADLVIQTGSGKGTGTDPNIIFAVPGLGLTSGSGLVSPTGMLYLGNSSVTNQLSATIKGSVVITGPKVGATQDYAELYLNGGNGAQVYLISAGSNQNHIFIPDGYAIGLDIQGNSSGTRLITFDTTTNAKQVRILGSQSNSAANAGDVGEYKSSFVTAPSGLSLSSTSAKTITSIALTAGDWDVTAIGGLDGNLTGANFQASISTTNNTLGTQLGYDTVQVPLDSTSSADVTLSIPGVQALIANGATTTYYLVVKATFTGTALGYGSIVARRRR